MFTKTTMLSQAMRAVPAVRRVLEYHAIAADDRPVEQAAKDAGLCGCELLGAMNLVARDGGGLWTMSAPALADHIVATHHAWLKANLPAGTDLLAAARAPSARPQLLDELIAVHAGLRSEIEMHLAKEERILFPMIRQLALGQPIEFGCGHVEGPIAQMRHEHDNARAALRQIKAVRLSGILDDAGIEPTTRLAVERHLQSLHDDLVLHIYKENHILFPQAAALAGERQMEGVS